jgi:hypothetical protein
MHLIALPRMVQVNSLVTFDTVNVPFVPVVWANDAAHGAVVEAVVDSVQPPEPRLWVPPVNVRPVIVAAPVAELVMSPVSTESVKDTVTKPEVVVALVAVAEKAPVYSFPSLAPHAVPVPAVEQTLADAVAEPITAMRASAATAATPTIFKCFI